MPPNLTEIITTTLRNRSGKLADNVTRNNALLSRLKERGKIKTVSGGRTIVQELEYANNQTAGWYSGYDPLNVNPSEVFSAAEFNWRQAAVAVSISGLEQLMNSGKEAIIDLLEARINNAERTMENLVAKSVYSDGTNAKELEGLQKLIADAPATGSVGGIDRATWLFWRNMVFDATTDGGLAAASTNIQSYMNRIYVKLVRGADRPDLIMADDNYWRLYLESLQAIQRITNEKMASAGFMNLKYMDADVVLDGGVQSFAGDVTVIPPAGCPANHMYFLNTRYIHYRPHKDRNMVPLEPGERFSVNQDAMVKIIAFAGNMTLSNAALQGVLKD